jgi:hypothetical protein
MLVSALGTHMRLQSESEGREHPAHLGFTGQNIDPCYPTITYELNFPAL